MGVLAIDAALGMAPSTDNACLNSCRVQRRAVAHAIHGTADMAREERSLLLLHYIVRHSCTRTCQGEQ